MFGLQEGEAQVLVKRLPIRAGVPVNVCKILVVCCLDECLHDRACQTLMPKLRPGEDVDNPSEFTIRCGRLPHNLEDLQEASRSNILTIQSNPGKDIAPEML